MGSLFSVLLLLNKTPTECVLFKKKKFSHTDNIQRLYCKKMKTKGLKDTEV